MTRIDTSLGYRIRQIRKANRLTQLAFASSLGIAQGFLSSLECGKKIPSDTFLIALAHRYQVNEHWLFSGEPAHLSPEPATNASASLTTGLIPLLKKVHPDFPDQLAQEDVVGHIAWPGSPADSYALFAYGDFMAPTIQDSDLVLFQPGGNARNGDIVLVTSKWGDVILRRYRAMDEEIWFAPENSTYKPFQASSHSRLIGVVTDVWRKVKL